MSLHDEIFEQPEATRRLLVQEWNNIQEIARELKQKNIKYIFLAARGTSDNAGLYAKYLFGAHNGIPVALAAPSLIGIYQSPPKLEGGMVLAISQSGQSPDIVGVIEEGNRQNVPTLAITNNPDSPLATSATYSINIRAGEEKAVAATKTYTAELLAIAMLSAGLSDSPEYYEALQHVPAYMTQALKLDTVVAQAVAPFYYMDQCVVIGRGYNYATAHEWALKTKEMTYVVAEPYSSADFLHGPIAMVEDRFPVFMVATNGAVYPQLLELAEKLKHDLRANLLIVSDETEIMQLSSAPLRMPTGMPEWISPLINIIPGQLFCYYLADFRGQETKSPRGLSKVTRTT